MQISETPVYTTGDVYEGGGKVPKTMWRKCRNVKFTEARRVFFKVWVNRVKKRT